MALMVVILPFFIIMLWIFVSLYIHPYLGLPVAYIILIGFVAILMEITKKEMVETKGSFDRFHSLMMEIFDREKLIVLQEFERQRKRLA